MSSTRTFSFFPVFFFKTDVVFAVFSAVRQGYRPPMPTAAEETELRVAERSVSQTSVERSVSQRLKEGASKLIGGGARNAETTTTTTMGHIPHVQY
jgi:hypothetical protein